MELREIIVSEVRAKYKGQRGCQTLFAEQMKESNANLFNGLKGNVTINKIKKYAEHLDGKLIYQTAEGTQHEIK